MPQPLLAARALALGYRGRAPPVFADLDLEIRAREIVALVGEAGCGKSSLLGLLAGLGKPTAGEVRYRGTSVRRTPADVSVVLQDPCLLPWLSVQGNAAFGLGRRAAPDRPCPGALRVGGSDRRAAAALPLLGADRRGLHGRPGECGPSAFADHGLVALRLQIPGQGHCLEPYGRVGTHSRPDRRFGECIGRQEDRGAVPVLDP
jgi:hypothetical protein